MWPSTREALAEQRYIQDAALRLIRYHERPELNHVTLERLRRWSDGRYSDAELCAAMDSLRAGGFVCDISSDVGEMAWLLMPKYL